LLCVSGDFEGLLRASVTSSYANDDVSFQIIVNSALDVFPDAKPVPGLMVGNTDTKHYLHLSDHIYRFTPVLLRVNSEFKTYVIVALRATRRSAFTVWTSRSR